MPVTAPKVLFLCKTNISKLPDDIHRFKLLQHIVLKNCTCLEKLPGSIIELVHLRTFIKGLHVNDVVIPKGFGRVTNLRTLYGFRYTWTKIESGVVWMSWRLFLS